MGDTTVKKTQEPWGPTQDPWKNIINIGGNLIGQRPDTTTPDTLRNLVGQYGDLIGSTGQRYDQLYNQTQGQYGDLYNQTQGQYGSLYNQTSGQYGDLISNLRRPTAQISTGGFSRELAGLKGPGANERYLSGIAAGQSGADSPAFQEALNYQTDQVANALKDRYAAAGRSFSGAEAADYGRSVGGLRAQTMADQFNQDRAAQMAAAGQISGEDLGRSSARTGILSNIAGVQGQNIANDQNRLGMLGNAINSRAGALGGILGNQTSGLAGILGNQTSGLAGILGGQAGALNSLMQGQGGMAQALQGANDQAKWGDLMRYAQLLQGPGGGTTTEPGPNRFLQLIGGLGGLIGGFGGLMGQPGTGGQMGTPGAKTYAPPVNPYGGIVPQGAY